MKDRKIAVSRGLPRHSNGGTLRYGGAKTPAFPEPLAGSKEAGRPDFDITHPDKWPLWLRNMDTENAAVEILADGTVVWWGGTVHDGIWCGGYFMGGAFRDGIWLDGQFMGHWINGEWRGGLFRSGYWDTGVFRAGTFRGVWLGGIWMGGTFDGFRVKTSVPPTLDD